MAQGAQKYTSSKLKILLLLPVWLLIKIGQTPLLIVHSSWLIVNRIFSGFFLIFKRTNYQLSVNSYLLKPKRKRGRPRSLPYRVYLRHKTRKLLKRFFPTPLRIGIALTIVSVVLFIYSFLLITVSHDLPSPQSLTQDNAPLTTEFYDRNGKLLYRLYEGRNRTLVNLSDVPPNLVNATISIEDKNFWGHKGVDPVGTLRAILSDAQGGNLQGGSTITQQLIKNTLLTTDRTWQRKIREVLLAFWSERLYSKSQILQMYFNSVGYGGPAWGVEAASQTYFQKHVKDLSLAQSAYLAGLPAAPTTYSPFGPHPELGKKRQKEVLQRMVELQFISKDQADQAYSENLTFQPPVSNIKAPHFVMYVRALLSQKYGDRTVSQGGLKVTTSLDLDVQRMTEQVVAEQVSKLSSLNVSNGAAMIEDSRSGQILAMVGSKDYFDPSGGNFNVTLAQRQPGSSIKPITYVTGFKQGYSPGTVLLDAPVNFNGYAPVNYDNKFHGAITIRTALGSSYNVPAVKMLALVGLPNMIQTAHDMGITTLNDSNRYGLSLTLGGGEIRLIDMMSVYSTLSQLGVKHEATPVLKVTDSKGEVLEDNTNPDGIRVIPAGLAYLITDILVDNKARTPAFGPNSLLQIPGHTVAVKTGTTDSKRDNWTFGYTPNLVVGVWVGNNDNSPMDPALTSGITGAAPIWNQLMVNLLSDRPNLAFNRPTEVIDGVVDGNKDLVVAGVPGKTIATTSRKKVDDKDVITLSDPFSSITSDQSALPAPR